MRRVLLPRSVVLLFAAVASWAAPPQRIVSTAPSITEMLFALGLGDRIVGVTEYCRYPEAARRITKIGTYIQPNVEVILSLEPDLVIIQENPARLREKFEAVRLPVLELRHTTIEDIFAALRTLGRATGVEDRAERVVARMRAELERIRARTAQLPRRRVMLVIGRTPGSLRDLFVVGKASYLNELIAIAGGRNVFADAPAAYPRVPLEEILARDPEVIIDRGDMGASTEATEEHKSAVRRLWQQYASLTAVRRGAVYPVASDIYVVPGPRMVEAVRAIARMLHPEADW